MTEVSAEVSDAAQTASNPDVPEAGQLVRVRGQQWVVSQVNNSHQPQDELAATRLPGRTLVTLTSVSDDDLGDELTVAWEIEPGREIVPATQLPAVTPSELGRPAATRRLPRRRPLGHRRQRRHPDAPGPVPVRHHDRGVPARTRRPRPRHAASQPAHRRRRGPRQDDRGRPGRAGDAAQTPGTARHRRLPGVAHAQVARGDGGQVRPRLHDRGHRPAQGAPAIPRAEANPFAVYPRTIISLQWLRTPRVQRMLDEVLTSESASPASSTC